jgi:AcrR family transcriptional regulator
MATLREEWLPCEGEGRDGVAEVTDAAFVRARKPEHRAVRKQAILDAAVALLGEMPVAEISLRELSRRAGQATSNVLRYFETREAVFLELLNQEREQWLEELDGRLTDASPAGAFTADGFARAYAESLARRRLLCELTSVLSSVLEHNLSVPAVRTFKLRALADNRRLAGIISDHVPGLGAASATELASATGVLVAGLWPLANPSPTVVEATGDPGLAAAHVDFTGRLGRMISLLILGLGQEPERPGR